MDRNYTIQALAGSAGALLATIFGEWNAAFKWLLFLIFFDYISGMMAGYFQGKLSSQVGIRGIFKKIMYLIFVAIAFGIEEITKQPSIRMGVIFCLCANESLSIIENAAKMKVPVPTILLKGIEFWKKCSMQDNECKPKGEKNDVSNTTEIDK